MRAILLILAFLWPSLAYSQITVPDRVDVHKPLVATLQLGEQIPEGAKVRGSWDVPGAAWLPCGDSIHIWAAPGKVQITASGVWVLTRDVTIGEETFPVLVDFGQYNYNAEVLVGEDPNPPPPPPPPPGGPYEIAMFYQADQLDNYPQSQRNLLTSLSLREKLWADNHKVAEIFEWSSTSTTTGPYADFFAAVRDKTAPRLAIRPVSGGPVIDIALPMNESDFLAFLADPK